MLSVELMPKNRAHRVPGTKFYFHPLISFHFNDCSSHSFLLPIESKVKTTRMPSLNAFFISLPLSLLLAPSILASPIPIPPKLEHLGDLKTPSMVSQSPTFHLI